jgi:NADP-dependent 3-hydroxy acid dehydrogenase YdfG
MDPNEFGISTLPLQHLPYPAISAETLKGTNKGKVAVVTGARQGIGAAIAEALAKSGADVAILDLDVESQDGTKKACQKHGIRVEAYACDVTDEKAVLSTFDKIEKDLGPIEYVQAFVPLQPCTVRSST